MRLIPRRVAWWDERLGLLGNRDAEKSPRKRHLLCRYDWSLAIVPLDQRRSAVLDSQTLYDVYFVGSYPIDEIQGQGHTARPL